MFHEQGSHVQKSVLLLWIKENKCFWIRTFNICTRGWFSKLGDWLWKIHQLFLSNW